MSPHFRRGVAYGDRFDDEILDGVRSGHTFSAIAARVGISRYYVGLRARALGYSATTKPPLSRRGDIDFSRPLRRAHSPSRVIACTIASRPDEGPSRLVRALRNRTLAVGSDGLDPSHGVACLHAAGLTLPEIERLTGMPARVVVEAIRRHGSLGAAKGRHRVPTPGGVPHVSEARL